MRNNINMRKYLRKKVKLIDNESKEWEGFVTDYNSSVDNDGYESFFIKISKNPYYKDDFGSYEFYKEDIKSVEIIK